ncbi:MAG: DUF3726 domain-containing protein [Thalassobaculum sp.]
MRVSLNEARTLATKAAAGSGLPPGTADEIGHAAAWLAAVGEDGAGAVAAGLSGSRLSDGARTVSSGPGIVDLLLSTAPETALSVEAADAPALLVGLIGQALAREPVPAMVTVSTATGASLRIRGDGVSASPGVLGTAQDAPSLTLVLAPAKAASPRAATTGVTVDPAAWRTLAALAARTLVPADAPSRFRGAGAGDIDNE